MPAEPDWARLADLLIRRRVDMDPAFQNRTRFAAQRQIDYRVVGDIERARRPNFGPAAKAAIERAYGLAVGALDHALAGGPLRVEDQPQEPEPGPFDHDPQLRELAGLWRDMDEQQKGIIMAAARATHVAAAPQGRRTGTSG